MQTTTKMRKLNLAFSEDGRFLSVEERLELARKERQLEADRQMQVKNAEREAELAVFQEGLFKQVEMLVKIEAGK